MKMLGKRAIVTGSSSGIGRSVATLLAREGAQVVVNASGSRPDSLEAIEAVVDEINAAGGRAAGFACSVDDPEGAKALVAHCVEAFGGVDILVSNAGAYSPTSLHACSLEDWRAMLRINLDGAFLLSREVLPHMMRQGWGRVLYASSSAALGKAGGSGYAAAKSGLYGLMRAAAADYGPYGVTVNSYNPESRGTMGGTDDQAVLEATARHFHERGYISAVEAESLAQIGSPDGVAPWIVYLCSEAAANINGKIFAVEGSRISLIDEPAEGRVVYRDARSDRPWTLAELERLAPQAFPLANRWPRQEGQSLADWEAG